MFLFKKNLIYASTDFVLQKKIKSEDIIIIFVVGAI